MAKLPPVRKRTSYADITSDDLVFALFWDRALGEIGAMREDREMLVRGKTLDNLRITFKHGKHNQSSHGRKGRAGRAGQSAYQAARSGGAGHAQALAASRAATQAERQAISQEQQAARVGRLNTQAARARRAAESGQVTPAQRAQLLAKADRLDARARGEKVGPMQRVKPEPPAPAVPPIRYDSKGRPRPETRAERRARLNIQTTGDKEAEARWRADKQTASDQMTAIKAREQQIRTQRDRETAFAVGSDGKVLMNKDGRQYSVDITPAEFARLRKDGNAIFTHNHPRYADLPASDPRRVGNSFSPDDIMAATRGNVAEMRAVTPVRTYYVKRPPQGWDENYWQAEIAPRYIAANRQTKMEFQAAVNAGRMTPAEAEAQHYHRVWSQVFNSLGVEYGYTQP